MRSSRLIALSIVVCSWNLDRYNFCGCHPIVRSFWAVARVRQQRRAVRCLVQDSCWLLTRRVGEVSQKSPFIQSFVGFFSEPHRRTDRKWWRVTDPDTPLLSVDNSHPDGLHEFRQENGQSRSSVGVKFWQKVLRRYLTSSRRFWSVLLVVDVCSGQSCTSPPWSWSPDPQMVIPMHWSFFYPSLSSNESAQFQWLWEWAV